MNRNIQTKDFRFNIGDTIVDNNKNITIINRVRKIQNNGHLKKMYQYHCNICGWDNGWRSEYDLKRNKYCACCQGDVTVEGINDIPTTAPWMVDYFQGGYDEAKLYTKSSGKNIVPICPHCKKIHNKKVRIITIYKQHGFGCECVSDKISYPEKFIMKLLINNNIDYIYQLTKSNMEWVGKYKYDFYLKDYDIIIETNGSQHYRNSKFSIPLEELQKIDKLKKEIALKNGIKHYITIDCSKSNMLYIKDSILQTDLFDILHLNANDINWIECDLFAQSNLVKEVCDYYMKVDKNTSSIAIFFKLHTSTICRYLNKGKEYGWCNYNSNIHKIEVLNKSGKSMGIYKSASYIVENTDYANSQTCIYRVCVGKNKTHNGYIFRYAE